MKKLTAILLAILMTLFATSCLPQKGEDALNTTKPTPNTDSTKAGPTTLKYWVAPADPNVCPNYDQNEAYKVVQADTNIDIQWIHPPVGQAPEQFNLMVAANDLPDLIQYDWGSYPGGIEAAVTGKIIVSLNDLISQKMPNYKKFLVKFPEVEKMAKTDSGLHCVLPQIYTTTPENSKDHQGIDGRIPAYETFLGLFIRQDWLKELNLPVPVTIDDWFTTLTAFKEKKGAKAPLSLTTNFLKTTVAFASAFDISIGFYEDNKVVKYGPYEPAYLKYLTVLNRMYKEKLFDNDFALLDEPAMTAKVLTGQTGAWSGYTSTHLGVLHDQLHKENPSTTFYPIGVTNPVLTNGQKLKYRQANYPVIRQNAVAITTACKDLDSAAKLLDYGFTEKGNSILNWGPEGGSYVIKDGWPTWSEAVGKNPKGLTPTQAFKNYTAYNGPYPTDHWTRLLSKGSYKTPESITALKTWEYTNGSNPATMPPVSLLPSETAKYANLFNEVNTFVSEKYTKFIMGEEPLDKFSSYISTLEKMGIKDLLSMQQASLDRYYKR